MSVMLAAMYVPMLLDSDSEDLGSDNDIDDFDLDAMYAFEQLTRPGLNTAKQDSDENLLPAVYRLGELLDLRPTANGGLQTPALGGQRSRHSSSTKKPKVDSLLDIAARCVAKTCSCKDLEGQLVPLDESLLCKVAYWSFPQDIKHIQAVIAVGERRRGDTSPWSKGTAMYRSGRMKEMWQVGFMLTAYIHKFENSFQSSDQNLEVRVSLTFEKQGILSGTCSDCKEGIWCPHMVCAAVYRIANPDKVRVHAPMTETLSTLTRDQLQKMLQYAVQEDPAGILGKLFKYLDNIRDSNSELNSIMGAPDPTFGTLPTEKTHWQLSLEEFEQNFAVELKDCGSYGRNFGASYDISSKLNQPVFRYIRKILDLVQAGDVMAAISALNRITKRAISVTQSSPGQSSFDRFCYELSRLYTQFMLYFGHHNEYKRVLLIHIRSHQISTQSLGSRKVIPSNWADLPSITEVCGYVPEDHLKQGLFIEPLSAQNVAHWPPDLMKLLNGEVSIAESAYEEDVRLMLARLECLLTLEESALAYKKAGRLSARILRVLSKAALADSVLGVKLKMSGDSASKTASPFIHLISPLQGNLAYASSSTATSSDNNTAMEPQCTETTPYKGRPSGQKRSARKRKVNSCCSQHHPPQTKKVRKSIQTSTPSPRGEKFLPLKEGLLGYSMLYCCSNVIVCERSLQESIEDEDVMAGFCALALEVSRYRWMSRLGSTDNEAAENRCLEKLEQLLQRYLVSHPKSAKQALQLYVKAWKSDGVEFYEGLYPLVLADVMFSLDRAAATRSDWCSKLDMVYVCSEFILDNADPMTRFRPLPGRNNTLHDSANRNFKSFIETFFSFLDIDRKDQMELVLKVLSQFEKYSNVKLLHAVKESIMYNTGKFKEHKAILQKCFSIGLTAMLLKGESYGGWGGYGWMSSSSGSSPDVSYLCGLVGKLGVECLTSLHGKWHKILRSADLVVLVDALKLRNSPDELPQEAVQLLREYYQQNSMHDVENSLSLLECYTPGSSSFREVIETIYENWKWYDGEFLFEIAKREQASGVKESANKKGRKVGSVLLPNAFRFIEKAITKLAMRRELPPVILMHLDWTYAMCISGTTPSRQKGGLFEKVVKLVETEVKDNPAVLVSILSFAMKERSVQQLVKPLYTCLFSAYRDYFVKAVGSPGTYKSVISSIKEAIERCNTCVPDGERRFRVEVLHMLRRLHSGKKKLLRMLDEQFGPSDFDSD